MQRLLFTTESISFGRYFSIIWLQMGTLEVVIPPDILNDNESTEGGGVAVEGGIVRLRCHGTGVPEPTVLWRREDSRSLVLRHEGGREKQGETRPLRESISNRRKHFIYVH